MTPLMLQDKLVEELKRLFSDFLYKAPSGERVPINIYPQSLPKNDSDDDDDPMPYVIVRLTKGEDAGTRYSFNTVSIVLIIGAFDDTLEAQGHRVVSNIIQKVYERFQENPNLTNQAVYSGGFHWMLQDDDYYPYSFGACSLDFHIAAIRREDQFV